MKQLKIGILGEIRAGKDTVSELIEHEIRESGGKPTRFLAFSKGIHDVIQLTMPELYAKGKPRKALQDIGQELRKHKPDVWVDYLFNHGEFAWAEIARDNIILTDVRQPNEAIRLQEKGFKIIKVTASDEVRAERAIRAGDNFTPEMFKHETEIAVHSCPYDYLIDNSFSIDVLEERVRVILEEVLSYE